MLAHQSFAAFLVICFLLTITPGADTALVLKSAISGGTKNFVATIIGICSGLLFHASMSSLGLSAVLQESAEIYLVVKFIGAGYLIYIGAKGLYEAWVKTPVVSDKAKDESSQVTTGWAEFRLGLLTNILNPKVAVFYLTFLPQFVDIQRNVFFQSIGLALVHVSMCLVWLFLVGYFVLYFKTQLAKPAVRRSVETLTSFALLAFGLKLAASTKV